MHFVIQKLTRFFTFVVFVVLSVLIGSSNGSGPGDYEKPSCPECPEGQVNRDYGGPDY